MNRPLAAVLLMLLAGCTGPAPNDDGTPVLVTNPDDYSYLNGTSPTSRPHLHDYWSGKDTLTLVDGEWQGRQESAISGDYKVYAAEFLPPDGNVVPQGTDRVTIRVTLTPAPGDRISDLALLYNTAASTELPDADNAVPFVDGQITIATQDEDNDLPHQVVSGWRFVVVGQGEQGIYRFKGTMHLLVEAHRGPDPIPTYPGHPDQWHNATQIPLLTEERAMYDLWLEPLGGCQPFLKADNCPVAHRADDGQLVPTDARYVEVTLTTTDEFPNGIQLHYHGGETRTFRTVQPAESQGNQRIYRIQVDGNGDGPYALRSLWEFLVTGTAANGIRTLEGASYTIEATAYRHDPIQPVPYSSSGLRIFDMAHPPKGNDTNHVFTPNEQWEVPIRITGTNLTIAVGLYNGMTSNLRIDGPGTCDAKGAQIMVIGASTWSDVARVTCNAKPGTVTLKIDATGSSFYGVLRIDGANFQ